MSIITCSNASLRSETKQKTIQKKRKASKKRRESSKKKKRAQKKTTSSSGGGSSDRQGVLFRSGKLDISKLSDWGREETHEKMVALAKKFVIEMLTAKFGSPNGIPIQCDWPVGSKKPLINLMRPGVKRVYFGMNKPSDDETKPRINEEPQSKKSETQDSNYVRRYTYGCKSGANTVGTDPRKLRTLPFTDTLQQLAAYLLNLIKTCYVPALEDSSCRPMKLEALNHCTCLPYMGLDFLPDKAKGSKLAFHCDQLHTLNGHFRFNSNSQEFWTPTVVFTVGDPRTLKFRRCKAIYRDLKTRHKYMIKGRLPGEKVESIQLDEGSIFVLHPSDEKPERRFGEEELSWFQHGGVQLKKGLSFAFVFRAVSCDDLYHVKSHQKKQVSTDLRYLCGYSGQNTQSRRQLIDKTMTAFERIQGRAELKKSEAFEKWRASKVGWEEA